MLADAEAALADLASDVARQKAASEGATTTARAAAANDDHRTHPAVVRLLEACPVPGLAAYVTSAPGPPPRPPRGRGAQLSDRLSAAAAGLAAGADVARWAAAAVADLAAKPDGELIAAASRCPHIDWEGGGGEYGGDGGGGGGGGNPPSTAAPAVVALAAAGLATTATLRSRVADALADPALLAADPAPLASYALLWGLAPFLDGRVVRAVAALEGALLVVEWEGGRLF